MAYTYLIGWTEQDRYYYGVRFAKDCRPADLFKKYFTSSNTVKKFIAEHGMPDVVQVRKEFTTKEAARAWEHKVLRRMRVIKSDRWLNQTDNHAFSDEACAKSAKARKGGKKSAEFRAALSVKKKADFASGKVKPSRLGKPMDEATKEKLRAKLKAYKRTPEQEAERIAKLKATVAARRGVA